MHLTKRFGIVAASQLPLHFLLAVKSPYSPLQLLIGMSHEQLNAAHRVLGKIIQLLLALHGIFYINFFVRINVIAKRIKDLDVILGVACLASITLISTSALASIRRWNYRVFYVIHVVLASMFLPIAFFHVHHIREYILESVAIYAVHAILRGIHSKTQSCSISRISGTNLVKVEFPVSTSRAEYNGGQHVYLTLPSSGAACFPSLFLHNPFTIASLPAEDRSVMLVARVLQGNTTKLADFADAQRKLPLRIEGPYGASSHLPDLATHFDRVLCVAGGVGATFILPLWRSALARWASNDSLLGSELRLVWAVRSTREVSWALPLSEAETIEGLSEAEIYVTGAQQRSRNTDQDSVELEQMNLSNAEGNENVMLGANAKFRQGRPDLRNIVTQFCSGHAGRICVLFCGPSGMGKELRRQVGKQVYQGKDVFWHAEEFGL